MIKYANLSYFTWIWLRINLFSISSILVVAAVIVVSYIRECIHTFDLGRFVGHYLFHLGHSFVMHSWCFGHLVSWHTVYILKQQEETNGHQDTDPAMKWVEISKVYHLQLLVSTNRWRNQIWKCKTWNIFVYHDMIAFTILHA